MQTPFFLRALKLHFGALLLFGLAAPLAATGACTAIGPSTEDDGGDDGGDGDGDGASCPVGYDACKGFCVDFVTNSTSCGTCGNACATGSFCAASTCSCQAGLSACTTGCSDVISDGLNCGACGTACTAGTVCSLGACADSCAEGLTQCGASCADTMTNVAHCGACDSPCMNGTTCSGGMCSCPVGVVCDEGIPTGTGGNSGTGGNDGTGSGGGEGDEPFGGYVTAFDWKGFTFTATWGDATISPENYGDVTGFPLCSTGSVPANTGTGPSLVTHGAMIGWNINQTTEDGAPALATNPTLDGIAYKITNNGNAQIRLAIQGPNGATDENDRWCADIGTGGEGFVPWAGFNTQCWVGGTGAEYAMQPISQVIIQVPSQNAGATTYNFCVENLAPSDEEGNQGGAGCDLGTAVGSPVNGTMSMSNALDRKPANNGNPQYYVQNNAFNAPGGITYNLSYSGNSFNITAQTGTRGTNEAPVGYPSLFIGSSGGNGQATTGSNLAKQVVGLTDIPTALKWTAPSSGQYNVAYDVWFAPGAGDQGPGSRSFLMVWFHRTAGIYAEGEGENHSGGTFSINGKSFSTYISTQFEGRPIISYVAQGQINEWAFDLNDFINDAKTRTSSGNGGRPAISDSLYLTNIFAGAEIWSGSQGLAVNGFCAQVK